MATGWVRVEFLYTRTQPAGLTLKPKPAPLIKQVFFPKPKPALSGSVGPATLGPIHGLIKKKKKKLPESLSRVEQKTSQQCKPK